MKCKVYEFEKIIYKGNLGQDLFIFCLKQEKRLFKFIFIHIFYVFLFSINKITLEQHYIRYFSFLREMKDIKNIINQFWKTHYYKLNQDFLSRITSDSWIISALPIDLIAPILTEYKINNICATDFNLESSNLNGKIMVAGYRKKQLLENLKKSNIETFYGYRKSDAELFALAEDSYIYRSLRKILPFTKKRLENKKRKQLFLIVIIGLLLIWILAINFNFSMKVSEISTFRMYWKQFDLVILNGLPILIILLLLYLLTNRLWISFGVTNFLIFIMGFVNRTKLVYRDDPFIFSDLGLINESLEMTKRYDLNFSLSTVILIICSFLIIIILFLYEPKRKLIYKKRIMFGILLIIGSIVLFKPIYYNEKLYERTGDKTNINIWSYTQQYQVRGFIYPFLHSSKVSVLKKPDNYDEKKVEKILSKYEIEGIPTYENGKQINIISIMLEAYQDLSIFESVSLNKDIYKEFHEIQENSYSGRIISNVFGGGTVNTERSYLTGYYNIPDFRRPTNSFINYFSDEIYYTEAMHPIYGWFYNRRNVDEILGFKNFDYYENRFAKIQTQFLSDSEFFEYIKGGYEQAMENEQSYFHFSVTYQNHGPYTTEKIYDDEYLTRTDAMDDETYNMINNYLHGIEGTNYAIKSLIDYFNEQEEPVVILIFSDHNPFLGSDNVGYQQMGIDMNTATENGFMNYYGVPYFIWANKTAKNITGSEFRGEAPTISPMFLMPELFEILGWKGDSYLQYLIDLKKELSVINEPWYKEETLGVALSANGKRKLNEFYNVEYYWLKHIKK